MRRETDVSAGPLLVVVSPNSLSIATESVSRQ
ncbi:hypothetical protein HALLA_04625 (plasmid) [Halostagnicola larsenii XH-48]|uniref:Uncharacterized protein n=1 Tax=Halostagnicola larsenii XH-48 TaxID=797299 RepID=W0JWT0_9EURY|nr:hypothetical protein HALLA_04625 [Halostagnicola larsenii XH-48]